MQQNVSEWKKKKLPTPSQVPDLPVLLKGVQKQMTQMNQLVKEQTVASRKQAHASDVQLQWLERIHDRLDTIAVENRVTNLLLSELVALNRSIITEETDELREEIRNDAYGRVLNAE